ncbi:MAG: response regulator [Mariprofundus sp.]|nr:response regulator [Mariprofundus sp.]
MIIRSRKLKIYIPLLIGLTLFPLGTLLMWQHYQSTFKQMVEQNMQTFKAEALRTQANIERYFRLSLTEDIEREVSITMSDPQISYAVLVGGNGHIIYATDYSWKGRMLNEVKKINTINSLKHNKQALFIDSDNLKIIYAFLPISIQNQVSGLRSFEQGALYLAYDDSVHIEQLNSSQMWEALYFTFGTLMLILFLSLLLRRWVNEPIETLNKFVSNVQVDYKIEEIEVLEIEGKGELSLLAQELNKMDKQINHSKHFINQSNAILAGIVKNTPLKESLESIVLMYEKADSSLKASILLRRGNHLIHGAAPSLPVAYYQAIDGIKTGPNVGSCGTAAFLGERVIVSDIANDPRWQAYKELAFSHQLYACWSEPIIDLHGVVLGTFAMYYDHINSPKKQDLDTIKTGASLALLAIEHNQQASQLNKLNKALLQAGESIMVTDSAGTIEYVNEAFTKVTGYDVEETLGHNPKMLQSGKQSDAFYQRMWTAIIATGEWQGDLWNKRKSGEIYPERLHIRAMRDDEGNITNYVGTFSDISKQKSMEQAFRETQKMEALGTLVGGVAHNFNNILAGIMGKLYLARKKVSTPEIDPYLTSIDSLSQQAAEIIAQLMAFSHQGRQQSSDFNLNLVLKEAYKTAKLGVPEDIRLIEDFNSENLFVHGNAPQLQQVLMNLVNNARDAMQRDKNRYIAVSVRSCDEESRCKLNGEHCSVSKGVACLKVEDTGKGMDKETVAKIFDPFFTTKEVGQGTGLGLSMSIGTIQQFGGNIEVKSTLGEGTTFAVYLPLIEQPVQETGEASVLIKDEGAGQLILVVDDEDIVRETINEILTDFGYQVVTAADGKQALEVFRKQPNNFSLLLTDLVMPNMNGRELAQEIRNIVPSMPIIFASGYDMKLLDIDMTGFEDTQFITKPVDIAKLNRLIASLIL